MIPLDEYDNTALTRLDELSFTITELEVWEVKLSPEFNRDQYLQRMQPFKDENINKYKKYKEE